MNAASPLPLRDIHLPEPLSWWPPAWGWWLVAGITSFILLALWGWRRWRAGYRIRAAAQLELERICARHAKHADFSLLAADLSTLLRRVCLGYHPPHQVAGLTGAAWLELLDRTTPGFSFSQSGGEPLITAPFAPNSYGDPVRLVTACQRWIDSLPPKTPSYRLETETKELIP
ncbi:MAG: DUF4381 domain-containing protein [Magnetococcus sp. YQC-9]